MHKTTKIICLLFGILQLGVCTAFLWLEPEGLWHDVLWLYSSFVGICFFMTSYAHCSLQENAEKLMERHAHCLKLRYESQLQQKDKLANQQKQTIDQLNQEIGTLREAMECASVPSDTNGTELLNRLNVLRLKLYRQDPRTQKLFSSPNAPAASKDEETSFASLTQQEVKGILAATNDISNGFAQKLRTAFSLTENEQLICCLILLRQSNKQIAQLANLSEETLKKKKYRIKKKVCGNATASLSAFLRAFQDRCIGTGIM